VPPQVLPLPKVGGDQNVPQPKAGGDHNISQYYMATVEVLTLFKEAIFTTTHWAIISDEKYISKIYCSHWKSPGVSERMWCGNLHASI
jgi:hypothetical protein